MIIRLHDLVSKTDALLESLGTAIAVREPRDLPITRRVAVSIIAFDAVLDGWHYEKG